MSPDPLKQFMDTIMHLFWTRYLPLLVLALIVGIAIREGLEALANRFAQGMRKRRQNRRAKDYEQMTDDEMLNAPHSPKCGGLMILRKAERGARAGESFWGCNSFPKCRGTRAA
jgi:hypothetical protein